LTRRQRCLTLTVGLGLVGVFLTGFGCGLVCGLPLTGFFLVGFLCGLACGLAFVVFLCGLGFEVFFGDGLGCGRCDDRQHMSRRFE